MTFVVGELAARIRLDGQREFESGLQSSGKAFTKLQDLAKSAGNGVEAGMKAAGTAVDFLTVSTIALGTKVFSAGVQYNTLQQTSRAALKTLLGGAEAANAQMDKLDAFAKNSPFSKAVFIQAQQQLIGFGFAADKVLPTLDAIQQAVAATGGSSESIGEISSILAKVSASAKFTAEDLNMLGERGIDAATLIGGQMGLTGQEIREKITDGTLDAGAAIDALTAGMAAKFAGASANVKGTMDGASDRVKAATRDIGAALAEPFVSKNGGGRAVDWANQVADLLRAVEKQTTPFTNWIVGKMNPAFAGVTDTLYKAKVAVEGWNVNNIDRQLAHLTGYAPALGALAGVLASYGPIAGLLSRVGLSINPVLAGIVGLVAASPELRDALGDLLDEMSPLVPLGVNLAKVLASSLGAALPIVSDGIEVLTDVAGPLIDFLDDIPAPVLLGVAALLALQLGMRAATAAGTPLGGMIASTSAAMTVHSRAATAAGVQTGFFGTATSVARAQVVSLGGAMKAAFLTNPIGLAITVISLAAAGLVAAFASTSQKASENRDRMLALRDSLNQTTGAMTEATRTSLENAFTNSDAYSKAKELGLGVRDLTDAALGQKAAVDKVTKAVKDWNEAHTTQTGDGPVITDNAAMVTQAVKEQAAALKEAENYVREKAQADREAVAAMGEGERANYRFQEAMKVVSDETKSAEDRVNALRTALDLLKGGSLTAEQAQADLSRTVLDLKDVLAQADEAGAPLWQSFLDGAGNVNLSTRAGLAFSDQMSNARTKMLEAATAAADLALANGDEAGARDAATAAAQGYIDSLRQTLTDAGLTAEQIDALIGKYLDVPETVGTVITDNVPDVEARVADLASQILATPDKTVIITEPMSDLVRQRLIDLGVTVTTLPDGTVQISSSGGPEVEAELQRLTAERTVKVTIQRAFETILDLGANANGGIYKNGQKAYANGGIRIPGAFEAAGGQAFAKGGYPSGVYKGRPGGLIMFAEKETRREAFISDKVGQEARNRQILNEVAPWFNATVVDNSELARMRAAAAAGPAAVGAAAGVASAPASTPTTLVGDLFLDSGEFIGTVRGVVRAELEPDPEDALFDPSNERPRGGI